MIITKNKSVELTTFLMKGKLNQLENIKNDIEHCFYDTAIKAIDPDIKRLLLSKNVRFLKTKEGVYFTRKEDKIYFSTPKPLPTESQYGYCEIEINKDDFKSFSAYVSSYEKIKKEYDVLFFDIQSAILALRTSKKVLVEFPSLAKLLIERPAAAVSNLNDLKNKLIS